jgi:LAO/AO transport system kinase
MVDLFVLLLGPGAGDELQGVKRGIVELADLVVVNKADGALLDLARHTAADYTHALHLVGHAEVLLASAVEGSGIGEVWNAIAERVQEMRAAGELEAKRSQQARDWMWAEVTETLVERMQHDARSRADVEGLEADVRAGRISPAAAARRLLDR